MSRIRSRNTKPEMLVRSYLHGIGLRFRTNGKISINECSKGYLPGRPDLVLKKHGLVIFVNGCFWHYHKGCKRANIPKTNTKYWKTKIFNYVKRDEINHKLLLQKGWEIITIWECEINSKNFPKNIKAEISGKIDSW
jgi:DNA mismatch endonuclease, patch repair protein